jgi:hypothetical protein
MVELGARLNAMATLEEGGQATELKIVKTTDMTWPSPLDKLPRYPAVVVLDPEGKVVREYATGVHDTKLYSDVLNLQAGGDGDVWREKSLPPQAYAGGSGPEESSGAGAWIVAALSILAFLVAMAAGALYWPMAWLMMIAFDSASMPFSYPAGIRAMGMAWKDYLALACILVGVSVGGSILLSVVGGTAEMVLPWFLQWIFIDYLGIWIAWYTNLVIAYGIGRYYYANAPEIGWFESAPDAAEAAGGYA